MSAKSLAIKAGSGESGGCAAKAANLASGGPRLAGIPWSGQSFAKSVNAPRKSAEGAVAGLPAKARTTHGVSRAARSCEPGGRRSSWHWPWSRRRRVKPGWSGTEGRTPRGECRARTPAATGAGPSMAAVIPPGKLRKAMARVRRNQGSPGLDGMTVEELGAHLKYRWSEMRSRLPGAPYELQPVRRGEIPKGIGWGSPAWCADAARSLHPAGGDAGVAGGLGRKLADASYGFRPGRWAHQPVARVQKHIRADFG